VYFPSRVQILPLDGTARNVGSRGFVPSPCSLWLLLSPPQNKRQTRRESTRIFHDGCIASEPRSQFTHFDIFPPQASQPLDRYPMSAFFFLFLHKLQEPTCSHFNQQRRSGSCPEPLIGLHSYDMNGSEAGHPARTPITGDSNTYIGDQYNQHEGRGLSGADPIIPAPDRISGLAKPCLCILDCRRHCELMSTPFAKTGLQSPDHYSLPLDAQAGMLGSAQCLS
jgi:hypothetical protein